MGTRTLTVELPDELVELIGSPEAAAASAREALVLQLLRDVEISQDRAARWLGITRWDILQLMAKHKIPSGPETVEELDRELEVGRRYVKRSQTGASGFRPRSADTPPSHSPTPCRRERLRRPATG